MCKIITRHLVVSSISESENKCWLCMLRVTEELNYLNMSQTVKTPPLQHNHNSAAWHWDYINIQTYPAPSMTELAVSCLAHHMSSPWLCLTLTCISEFSHQQAMLSLWQHDVIIGYIIFFTIYISERYLYIYIHILFTTKCYAQLLMETMEM